MSPWSKMALNNAWANATIYASLTKIPIEAFTASRPGFFPSLARTMNHIYEVDLFYLDALEDGGKGRSLFQRDDVNEAKSLAGLQAEADMRFATYCKSLTEFDLAIPCHTERQHGITPENRANLILHLVQHQIHHRGQAHVQLSDAGVEPPQLDEFYLEFERASSAKMYWG